MKQTAISAATRALVQQTALSVNTDGDANLLSTLTETWDQLQEMKNQMASSVLEFVGHVEEITNSPQIMQNLGVHKGEFDKLLRVFYTDIDGFTRKMQEVRLQHDTRTGRIASMEELSLYNHLAMEYATLNQQLMTLIGPTIGSMMVLINETIPTIQSDNVTDVVVKNV